MITDEFNARETLWNIARFVVWLHVAVALPVLIGHAVISMLPTETI